MQGTRESGAGASGLRSLSVRPLGVGFRDPATRPRLEAGPGAASRTDYRALSRVRPPWEGRALDPEVEWGGDVGEGPARGQQAGRLPAARWVTVLGEGAVKPEKGRWNQQSGSTRAASGASCGLSGGDQMGVLLKASPLRRPLEGQGHASQGCSTGNRVLRGAEGPTCAAEGPALGEPRTSLPGRTPPAPAPHPGTRLSHPQVERGERR